MEEWQCPIESIDEDIREVVHVLHQNNMKPFMSCSGSYKDHRGESYIRQSATIEMLDSPIAREFMAVLISDRRFKCSIAKSRGYVFYDNNIPEGLRLKIEFENIGGNAQAELLKILQAVIQGKKAELAERRKIDTVCNLINSFDVKNGNEIEFSFNDEMVKEGEERDNYSITIRDRKDFCGLRDSFEGIIEGFMQNTNECRFFGNDFMTLLAVLEKIRREYPNIPHLRRGQEKKVVATDRVNKFMKGYNQKVEQAKAKLEAAEREKSMKTSLPPDLSELLGLPDTPPGSHGGKDD